ncbi:hypothetical protein AAVH_22587 [Aphelenchoides avenae]|nr:hypothetical protein AAVH_22587 [Aphelenchus avenae]
MICVYRPPSITASDDEKLQDDIATLLANEAHTVVCGDLNLPDIEWDIAPDDSTRNVNSSWNRFARDAKLKQFVSFPTRVSLLHLQSERPTIRS